MGPSRPYRPSRELENIWRLRLEEAAKRHKAASVDFKKILDEIVGGGDVPPDGSLAVRKARLHESAARREHMRILRQFTDLILYGKVPPEE